MQSLDSSGLLVNRRSFGEYGEYTASTLWKRDKPEVKSSSSYEVTIGRCSNSAYSAMANSIA